MSLVFGGSDPPSNDASFDGCAHSVPRVASRRDEAGSALGDDHIPVKNMMCAFGVPGYMIHGTPVAGFSVIPVVFSVAPGI